jgi:hypothetical protein
VLSDKNIVRMFALSMVMATLGFCYATATSNSAGRGLDGSAGASADSRAVGSSALRFTNALILDRTAPTTDIFDLGDACFGSFVTRYISAFGGVRPYKMSGTASLNTILAPGSSLSLGAAGCLMGSVANGTVFNGIFSANPGFEIVATDSTGTVVQTARGQFFLNMVTCGFNTFQFAVDRINNGVLGQSYISKLETVGGNAPVVFSVLPNTLTVNGTAVGVAGGLEAIGLSLAEDGTIFGRPLVTGLVTFRARATDLLRRTARERPITYVNGIQVTKVPGTALDQVISFNIEENNVSATDMTMLSVAVKGDLGKANKDTIKFSGIVNLSGQGSAILNGSDFAFRIGGATYSGKFNVKGQIVNQRGGPLVFADGTTMKATVNARSGQVKGQINKANLSKLLAADTLTDRSTRRAGMSMVFCSFVAASDMLEFATRVKGNKYAMDYKIGKIGTCLAGGFQMVSVKGSDKLDIAGAEANIWTTKFFAIPRFGIDTNPGLDNINSITVRIGTRFTQVISSPFLLSSAKGAAKLAPQKTKGPIVQKLQLNPLKFTGSLTTTPLSRFATGISTARAAANAGAGNANFNLGFDVDRRPGSADFVGEYGKQLYLPTRGATAAGGNPKVGATNRQNKWVDSVNLR